MSPKSPSRSPRRPPPAPPLELIILRLTDDGIGVGRHEDKDVFVVGAYPGETVSVTVEHTGQRRIVARLRKVLRPSPQRVPSPCRCAGRCQGCTLVSLAYPEQLRLKQEQVRLNLAQWKLPTSGIAPIWGAPEALGYRTTAKLVFGRARGKTLVGLYRRGSHEVVDIGDCPLHHPLINRIAAVVREECDRLGVWVYDAVRQRGLLRYLLVRVSPQRGKAMVTFVVAERNERELMHLAKWLKKKVPEVISIQQNINASSGNVIIGRDTRRLLGGEDLVDQVGDVRLRLAPASFFQVNHSQAERIYRLVSSWAGVDRTTTVLDLYCGVGGIALHLAREAGEVIGVEVVEEAVFNARDNARENGLDNCRFLAGDVVEVLGDLDLQPGTVAVVNPPRKGCEEAVLEALAASPIERLIYVSCGPDSLARDLAQLVQAGFVVSEVQPVDMFPQTLHVETVVRLDRAPQGKQR